MTSFFFQRSTIAPLVLLSSLTALVQPVWADSEQVGKTAQEVTVRIEAGESREGSGTLIAFQDGTYYVLTAAHVVRRSSLTYTIITQDDRRYTVQGSDIIRLNDVDMAIMAFEAPQNRHVVARFGDPTALVLGSQVYVSGWPASLAGLPVGQFVFSPGQVSIRSDVQIEGGYELGYSSNTRGGMSGGPVFNNDGALVAMHGAADGQAITGDSGEVIQLTTGINWGIPITTFTALAPEAFIENAKVRMERGDYSAAIADFSQGLFFNPQSANALVGRAFARFAIGRDWNDVIDDASNALRFDANNAQAYLVRGAANAQLNRHNDAIEDLRRAIPGLTGGLRVVALSLQARSYSEKGATREAITTATDAVETLEHPFAYFSRAAVREAFGDVVAASSDEAQARILLPTYSAGEYEAAILSQYDNFSGVRIAVNPTPTPTPSLTPSPTPTPTPTPTPQPPKNPGDPDTLFIANSLVETLAMSPNGNHIAAGSENGGVYLYSPRLHPHP
ncbi:MAG: serine protease [Coleofasciculaceae cyanobacterium RL_1_1]|nr:serine protease [Coleofasciculaceae cyanobacterium RL_1_1]